jgi:hypothetical protein
MVSLRLREDRAETFPTGLETCEEMPCESRKIPPQRTGWMAGPQDPCPSPLQNLRQYRLLGRSVLSGLKCPPSKYCNLQYESCKLLILISFLSYWEHFHNTVMQGEPHLGGCPVLLPILAKRDWRTGFHLVSHMMQNSEWHPCLRSRTLTSRMGVRQAISESEYISMDQLNHKSMGKGE